MKTKLYFSGNEKERKKKAPSLHAQHQLEEDVVTFSMTRWKGISDCWGLHMHRRMRHTFLHGFRNHVC